MELVRGEVVYDIHFTDRWQYHWPMEEGLVRQEQGSGRRLVFSEDRADGARLKRSWRSRKSACGASIRRGRRRRAGDRRQSHGRQGAGESDCTAGRTGISWVRTAGAARWCAIRGMFAVTSKMYPLTFLERDVRSRRSGQERVRSSGMPSIRRSMTATLPAISAIKEEYFVFYNPYDDEDVGKLRKWMGMVQQFSNERGVVWTAPTLSTKGPLPYQRLGSLYDVVKEIKQLVDPNNILEPRGALLDGSKLMSKSRHAKR